MNTESCSHAPTVVIIFIILSLVIIAIKIDFTLVGDALNSQVSLRFPWHLHFRFSSITTKPNKGNSELINLITAEIVATLSG